MALPWCTIEKNRAWSLTEVSRHCIQKNNTNSVVNGYSFIDLLQFHRLVLWSFTEENDENMVVRRSRLIDFWFLVNEHLGAQN